MEFLENLILGIYNAGASVFLPLVFLIIGLFFRMKFTDALRAGLKAGIGLAGVTLVTNYMISTLQPVINYYTETSGGTRFDIIDVPWSVSAALPFAIPVAVFLIPCFAVLTVLLVRFKVFHTLQLSIWDYGIQLTVIGFIYVLFDNMVLAIICGFLNFIFCLWLGDRCGERWSETLGLDGTTCSNVTQMSMAFPVCWIANKIMDHIPGINNHNFTPEKISAKIGIFGEPAVICLIVGAFMAIITGQDVTSIFTIGMGISASIVLIPHVIKIFLEGIGALTQGAQAWAGNKLGEGHKVYIACDMAMSIGSPVVITINSLMIPLAVAFALLVPGFRYFPTGLMGGIIYMVGICTVFCKNDFLRSFVCSFLYVIMMMTLMNYLAPEIGQVFAYLDPTLTGTVTSPTALDWMNVIACIIKRLFFM